MILLQIAAFVLGLSIIYLTITSAIRTLVVPRSDNVLLTRLVFIGVLRLLQIRMKKISTYEGRDRVLAYFAPVTLMLLPVIWLAVIAAGYALIYWALEVPSLYDAFLLSGSSLLTLGFRTADGFPAMALAFSEATVGLIMVAILIAYLPTMYSAFSRREKRVAMLEVRAGSPPSAVTMILRLNRNQGLDFFGDVMRDWEEWFVELEESHTSLAPLVFFRSPRGEHSWITAAGAVLDAAALMDAAVDQPRLINSVLCIRAGFIALRRIADFFEIPYNPDPQRGDPVSITREEFDEACDDLAAGGIRLKADRELAWLDFAGWRVNYDVPLLALARMTMAPYAPWSSDRSLQGAPRAGVTPRLNPLPAIAGKIRRRWRAPGG